MLFILIKSPMITNKVDPVFANHQYTSHCLSNED